MSYCSLNLWFFKNIQGKTIRTNTKKKSPCERSYSPWNLQFYYESTETEKFRKPQNIFGYDWVLYVNFWHSQYKNGMPLTSKMLACVFKIIVWMNLSPIISWWNMLFQVTVVLNRAVVASDWHFNNLHFWLSLLHFVTITCICTKGPNLAELLMYNN